MDDEAEATATRDSADLPLHAGAYPPGPHSRALLPAQLALSVRHLLIAMTVIASVIFGALSVGQWRGF